MDAQTFTKAKYMVHEYDLEIASKALQAGKIVLLPTDTVWSLACLARETTAIENVCSLKRVNSAENFELLVNSTTMLRQLVRRLHPRLETLLSFHTRPLTIVFDQPRATVPKLVRSDKSEFSVRVAQDDFCQELIDMIGEPLVVATANVEGEPFPQGFGSIRSDLIQGADYVVKFKQQDKTPDELSVMVRMTDREELDFLRE